MKTYTHINSRKAVRLATLIKSGEIGDRDIIQIFNADGRFVTKGNWFQDNILEMSHFFGFATKAGTGLTVSFKLYD